MTTVALGSDDRARLVYHGLPPLSRVRARRLLFGELGLLLLTAVLVAPTVLGAAGHEQAWLLPATKSRLFRDITGFAGLAVIAAQLSLIARRRLRRLTAPARQRWLQVHKVTGPLLLLVVVVHTGGRTGSNSNALLWASMCTMLVLAQSGHVFKAYVRLRALSLATSAAMSLDEAANADDGWVHLAGYQLHVVLAVAVTLLLCAHVFSVYFF
ncbi:MAG TPA: hypothetical protein VGV61_04945 [Thermoanaerobaculia bacterium]|nr:hypothetical protein [Thermoanaerobaculia bacterium]